MARAAATLSRRDGGRDYRYALHIRFLLGSGDPLTREHSWADQGLQPRASPWLREVGVVERRPVRMSRDVTSGRSNRPQHRKALYFPHRRLWITEYSCKVWCKPCRRRPIPRQHSRHSWRP
ncbi:hypothetical protein Taro_052929, partial [Colocasia esculenta]|nr:hypothetical protein [Colocasia esculenta]